MKSGYVLSSCALWSFTMFAVGCGGGPAPESATRAPSAEGRAYLLSTEPDAAKGVAEARESSKDADDITVVGRIGGDTNPWIDGQAAFLIVDSSLKPCSEGDDDHCATPWDYCCDADQLPKNKAMIKVVSSSGKTLATDARQLLGVKEMQTVVVRGKAKVDDSGNLTVLANGIFVRN